MAIDKSRLVPWHPYAMDDPTEDEWRIHYFESEYESAFDAQYDLDSAVDLRRSIDELWRSELEGKWREEYKNWNDGVNPLSYVDPQQTSVDSYLKARARVPEDVQSTFLVDHKTTDGDPSHAPITGT